MAKDINRHFLENVQMENKHEKMLTGNLGKPN